MPENKRSRSRSALPVEAAGELKTGELNRFNFWMQVIDATDVTGIFLHSVRYFQTSGFHTFTAFLHRR
jgi:hypothetical protein